MLCEMQSDSSKILTRVAMSISYDDKHYTTGTMIINFISFNFVSSLTQSTYFSSFLLAFSFTSWSDATSKSWAIIVKD